MVDQTADVVIIGAGFSGLQAALDLQEKGCSFVILEARDRVGGKAFSVQRPDGLGIQELGACWLNDSNQSTVWSYVKKFGLTPIVQNVKGSVACEDTDGSSHFFPFGSMPNFDQKDVDSISALQQTVEAASLDPVNFKPPIRAELDQLTFEQWCRRQSCCSEKAIRTATLWCRGTLGQDPSDVSALAFLEVARGAGGIIRLRYDGKDGAQNLRIQEGTQSIAIGMARLLPQDAIRLNHPVVSVQRAHESHVVTTTDGQRIQARAVIVSVPSPAYKNIQFDPPLPPSKQAYTSTVRYGCYAKYVCLFKTPFWRKQGACGLSQSFRGPLNHCRDTSVDSQGNYALTCFMASEPGRRWLALSDEDRREAIIRQLSSLFAVGHEAVRGELIDTITSEWMQDSWAGWGCPFAVAPPGVLGRCDDEEWCKQSVDGVYFVGTELTNQWRGYMEGALRSGKRGAVQVLCQLGMANTPSET